ncbi:MAG: hypothetical protein HPY55_12995 [Firmicutes bacterium]|nr:hypothetical protein [Bacillota bacterium]
MAVAILFGCVPAAHASPRHYKGFPTVELYVNGRYIQSEVPPLIIDGRTMVPLRVVSEALGEKVWWNPNLRSVVIGKAPVIAGYDVADEVIKVVQEIALEQWQKVCGFLGFKVDMPFIWAFGNRGTWLQQMIDLGTPGGEQAEKAARSLVGLAGKQTSILVEERDPYQISHTVAHELAHVLFRETGLAKSMPAWLNEGLAEYAANAVTGLKVGSPRGNSYWHQVRKQVLSRVADGTVQPLVEDYRTVYEQIDAYPNHAQSYLAVDLLVKWYGPSGVTKYLAFLKENGNHEESFRTAFGVGSADFRESFMLHLAEQAKRKTGSLVVEFSVPQSVSGIMSVFPAAATESRGWRLDGRSTVKVIVKEDGSFQIDAPPEATARYSLSKEPALLGIYVDYKTGVTLMNKVAKQQAFFLSSDQFGWYWRGTTVFWDDSSKEVFDDNLPGAVLASKIEEVP